MMGLADSGTHKIMVNTLGTKQSGMLERQHINTNHETGGVIQYLDSFGLGLGVQYSRACFLHPCQTVGATYRFTE